MSTNPSKLIVKLDYLISNKELTLFESYSNYLVSINQKNLKIHDIAKNKDYEFSTDLIKIITYQDLYDIDITSEVTFPVTDIIDISASKYCLPASDLLKNDINYHNLTGKIDSIFAFKGLTATLDKKQQEICIELEDNYNYFRSFSYHVSNKSPEISSMAGNVYIRTEDLPKDPEFFSQYYLVQSNVLPAWKYYSGKGIKVGVFDSGFVFRGDLGDNLIEIDAVSASKIDHSHGVSGVIAAKRNDDKLVGIAYNAQIYIHQILDIDTRCNIPDKKEILKKYDVINNSWGGENPSLVPNKMADNEEHISNEFKYAADYGRNGMGTIVVFSAGNKKEYDTNSNTAPRGFYTINVGGASKRELSLFDHKAPSFFSEGSSILLSAPAEYIPHLSAECIPHLDQLPSCTETTKRDSGTSLAAPIVSATAALMLEANPHLGWRDVQDILAITATRERLTDSVECFNRAKNWNSANLGMHFYNSDGFGSLDSTAAVRLAESWPLQQTSANYKIVRGQYNTHHHLYHFNVIDVVTFNNNVYLDLEFVSLKIKLDEVIICGVTLQLMSPSGTKVTLWNKSACLPNVTMPALPVEWEFGATSFRGENALGEWLLNIDGTDAQTGFFEKGYKGFSLDFYGREQHTEVHYFTSEIMLLQASTTPSTNITAVEIRPDSHIDNNNSTETIASPIAVVASSISSINSAATDYNTRIDLSGNSTSTIANITIIFENIKNIKNIFAGDGNDIIIASGQHLFIVPGRGYNEIHTKSNTTIYFPNLAVHSGNTSIYEFATNTHLQFGRGFTYANLTINKISENTTSIIGQDYFIHLIGNVENLGSDNFIFADFLLGNES